MERSLKSNRIAVSTFFFVNGFLHANLMGRLPQLQSELNISNGILGTLLFSSALGALIGMPVTGVLTNRISSDKLARATAILFCFFLPLITMTHQVWLTGILFFFMGTTMGSMDVTMNGQAVYVERLWLKPIMSSFHAVFSIGVACGAGVGALSSSYHIALPLHIGLMAILSILLIIRASSNLIHETEHTEKNDQPGFMFPHKSIIPLGIIAFCCMTGEGSMTDWSAIFMNKVILLGPTMGAIAFGVFASGMTLGRIFGDYTTEKLGKRKLMICDSILAIVGLSIALVFASATTTLIGFFMVGLGVATIVPIVFSTAGNIKGVNPSTGISMATSIGYTGFFIGPPVIGFLSDAYGLRLGLLFTLVLFVFMFFLVSKFIKK
ncbi:MAG: MFS transporter [Saprospiraceae bacterium]